MSLSKILSVISILALALFSACSEENEFKPYLKGDIVGFAYCFDEYGNQLEDFSGIKVFIEPDRNYNAITNKDGRYVIRDVINGTYDISFEKEGFGTMKLHSVKHLGGQPTVLNSYTGMEAPFLFQNITTLITNLEFVEDSSFRASVSLSGQYEPYRLHLRFFFSTEENFAIGSAQATKNITTYKYEINNFYTSFNSETEGLLFEQGSTVYYKACIYTSTYAIMLYNYYYISGTETYFDYESNITIYPNLSYESEEFSFIMP